MKHTFTLLFCLSLVFTLSAQSLVELTSSTVDSVGNNMDDQIIAATYVKNTSGRDLTLNWERIVEGDVPNNWLTSVCIRDFCYDPTVNSYFFDLPKDSTAYVAGYVFPGGEDGCATIKVKLTERNASDDELATAVFNICTEDAVATETPVSPRKLRIFPNPTTDSFELSNHEGIRHIIIYSLTGQELRRFSSENDRYYVGDLPDCLYLVALVDFKGKVVRTMRLSKRRLTP